MYKISFVRVTTALVVLVAGAYIVSAVMLTRRVDVGPREGDALSGSAGATSIIQNFQHIESHLDKIGWELSAKKAELLQKQANLFGIRMRFYTPEQDVVAISGDSGAIDLETKNVLIKGNVQASYNDQYHFFTDEVSWDAGKKILISPGAVRIIGPEGEIKGTYLLARPDKKKFVIWQGVTVDFKGNLAAPSLRGLGERS